VVRYWKALKGEVDEGGDEDGEMDRGESQTEALVALAENMWED